MVVLQQISIEDYDYWIELNNDPENLHFMESDREFDNEDFRAILSSDLVKWYLIKELNDDLEYYSVGLFTVYVRNSELYLGIIIDKNYRRQGFARKAFEDYLKYMDEAGIVTNLCYFTDNFAAKLYESLGYIPTGEKKIVRGREFIYARRGANGNK